jgi:hypothetical protein
LTVVVPVLPSTPPLDAVKLATPVPSLTRLMAPPPDWVMELMPAPPPNVTAPSLSPTVRVAAPAELLFRVTSPEALADSPLTVSLKPARSKVAAAPAAGLIVTEAAPVPWGILSFAARRIVPDDRVRAPPPGLMVPPRVRLPVPE